ncbi:MAG: hypothetical protein HRJ53_13390 [Acidobacteria bacterium Pan2503]|uniref:Uncharacterized protein n=1 Tax=Candidatus Acidiferrum panamense TaxID=2741543 RepID=A0A7V8NRC6_9BACT|nr:hypothetical protein [Candidatus Acidoferrum panamensis]
MIDSSQFLKQIKNRDPHLGMLLEQWFDAVNVSLNHLGVDTKGKVQPPPPIQGLNISPGSDHVHVTINDNSQVNKNIQYFVEYSVNDPSFTQPHVEHLGASRGRVLALPAKDSHGTVQNYYFRAYSQYLGSDPQTKQIYYGTKYTPTAVNLTGGSTLSLLPSQGSGTGRADGTQGGAGLGLVLNRAAVAQKRPPAPKVA